MDAFVEAALADAADQIEFFGIEEMPTAFIGGGTPSVLGARRMERLLSGLARLFAGLKSGPRELSVEANPESATPDFLRACLDGGVTRISLGAQSFDEKARKAVGRIGDPRLLSQRLESVARAFPGAFSADLISGLPFQSAEALAADIARLLDFGPAHVSMYGLTIDPETPLGRRELALGSAAIGLPGDEEADDMWIAGRDLLESSGLSQYEVSNFARPGSECLHNMRYWRMESWIGAGPSASGTVIPAGLGAGAIRRVYPQDIPAYLAAPRPALRIAAVEELSPEALMRESLLMGFRVTAGPDEALFAARFGRAIESLIPCAIALWRGRGFFAGDGIAPSKAGLLFTNAFLRDAFAELDCIRRVHTPPFRA